MSTSAIESLDICESLKQTAKKNKLLTYDSVLRLTKPVGSLSSKDILELKLAVSKKVFESIKPQTALQLQEKEKKSVTHLTTGCEVIDQALRGGILCHGITEISGESASGKTQFALQLSLTAQLSVEQGGLDSGTLYICTEDAFPSKRLYQMIKNFTSLHSNKTGIRKNLGDKIYIEHVPDFDGLIECLNRKASILLSSGAVKLVIIDSVAAQFRSDYESHEMYKRAQHISTLGTILYNITHQYDIPVVCINQVTSSMNPTGPQLIPALGLSWSNHVTTRLMLSRTNQILTIKQEDGRPVDTVVREMEILFAPHLPSMKVPYVIDHEGMKGFK